MAPKEIPHGTLYGRKHCDCQKCKDATNAYARRKHHLRGYGLPTTDFVDIEPVRAHVDRLIAAGMNMNRIEAVAGLSNRTVARLSRQQRVRPHIAEAILAITVPSPTTVDAAHTWRLIHGMVAQGYTRTHIGRMLGWTNHGGIKAGQVRVRADFAARVKALADECAIRPGPSIRARNLAVRRGWKASWLWDDLGQPEQTPSRQHSAA